MCALLQPASGVSLRLSASDAAIGVRLEAIDPATDKVRASAATAVTTSVTDAVVASQVVARAWGRGAATFVALPPAATPPAAAAAPATAGAAAATGLAAEVAAIASGVLAGAEFIIQGSLEDVHAGMGSASARPDAHSCAACALLHTRTLIHRNALICAHQSALASWPTCACSQRYLSRSLRVRRTTTSVSAATAAPRPRSTQVRAWDHSGWGKEVGRVC